MQHALRAFTPRDQKAVKAAADTMRGNAGLDVAAAITELGVGEALVSLLDEKGRPSPTERAYVLPPASQIGPISPAQRADLQAQSIVAGVYEKTLDRASAYEELKGQTAAQALADKEARAAAPAVGSGPASRSQAPAPTQNAPEAPPERGMLDELGDLMGGGRGRRRASIGEQLIKSAASSIAAKWAGRSSAGCWEVFWVVAGAKPVLLLQNLARWIHRCMACLVHQPVL